MYALILTSSGVLVGGIEVNSDLGDLNEFIEGHVSHGGNIVVFAEDESSAKMHLDYTLLV